MKLNSIYEYFMNICRYTDTAKLYDFIFVLIFFLGGEGGGCECNCFSYVCIHLNPQNVLLILLLFKHNNHRILITKPKKSFSYGIGEPKKSRFPNKYMCLFIVICRIFVYRNSVSPCRLLHRSKKNNINIIVLL